MIAFDGVTKQLGARKVLDGFTLAIAEGEAYVIIGRSGEGKSVTLKHIAALMRPDSGRVTVDGEDLTALPERDLDRVRLKIGFLFQGAALFDSLDVTENVAFALRRHTSLSEQAVRARVAECLSMVGLPDVENKRPSELSGGMRKRVGLARAIAISPRIMLYDEPTTGLDPIMADVINDLILSTTEKLGVTAVAVTHDMVSAYKIADRIGMLHEGKIIASGTPDEIRATRNPVVRQFVTGSATGPIPVG